MTNEKDIFKKIESLELDKYQMEALEEFITHMDDYDKTFEKISEFIFAMEPSIDIIKIQQKIEDLLRSYPPTLVSGLNNAEKWLLFNNITRRYISMVVTDIE